METHARSFRIWALALVALGALLLLAGCKGDTKAEQDASGETIADVLTTQAGPPQPGEFIAVFDQERFTTYYAVGVNLSLPAQQDEPSTHLNAKWSGPNCGLFGAVDYNNVFLLEKDHGDFVYERPPGTPGPVVRFTWVHPHPPCGDTPDHKDATITVVVSNPSGSFTCTYVGAATGKGTCQ